ncbi:FtsH protease activity modulator HflK [Christensenellaceae bacterium OttesenSCG-928-M15]|nr:FtsH protease activity modulator HflK [Christensenellaceae bacterium OttesenSCG-928-M15]
MNTKQVKRILRLSNLAIVVLLVVAIALSSFYVIEEQEQAVVTTFGQASTVTTPGIHFKVPIIQQVEIVPMIIKSFSIGYADKGQNLSGNVGYVSSDGSVLSESMMITSDYNFVNVDFFLEYQVLSPEDYLFAAKDPETILRNLALSYIRDTVGLHGVDEVITTGKNEIQAEIKEKLTNRLEEENIGIQLINITIQDAEPPTDEVKDSFKNVETAKQGKDTAINNARKYESEQIPAARAQEDAVLKEAQAEKESRINDAKAQVAVFNAIYEEYKKNPYMTKQRMFYEAMEEVLPRMKVYIDNGSGTVEKILPLEPFSGVSGSSANSGASNSSGSNN